MVITKINSCKVQSKIITVLFILFLPGLAYSQAKKLSKKQFIADSLTIIKPRIARPQFRLDNRTVFTNKQLINIAGFDAGVLLKEKLRVTLGYYSLATNDLSSLNKQLTQRCTEQITN